MSKMYMKAIITDPAHTARPVKFKGHVIPEYFTTTFYILDNNGIKLTPKQQSSLKDTWTIELYLRVTKIETVEVVRINVKGATPYKGHDLSPKSFDPSGSGTIQARHFNQLQDYRARFLSVAVQVVIQSHKYKKQPDGSHSWTLGEKIEVSIKELERINDEVEIFTYTKLDGHFYETFAKRYKELIRSGDRTPIKTLQKLYYSEKSVKHVQSYATTCRKKKLLSKAEKGGNSKVRKSTNRNDAH